MDAAKHWTIQRRLKARQRRQRIEAEIETLELQALTEAKVFGCATKATLKKIQNRKLKLNTL